ncbi:PAS and ANTAR domain-containing protein [Krasilnikoviella flava]|uniref:histidine kinase n=1 Tax=Krasilnikoviella flava TaxID=526729 RepID=A0A1T5L7T4_9MICO|nr:PAS and ANTAR domain-containing protein [Krasilnikoviella flava]SKC72041.1 PAS fold-containing protein [Krasilnikoviella flava]
MDQDKPTDEALEAALAPGVRPPVGLYRFDLTTGRWSWSDEIFAMHGFAPGEVVPTTELMLSHKHAADRDRVDSVLQHAAATGEAFSSVHRILDAQGRTRVIAVTGQGRRDTSTGEITELFGYFVDVTEANREAAQREATASIRAAAASRASIEQAKGVLMVGLGLDPDEAFVRLRATSNDLNVPVRTVAAWLMAWFGREGVTTFPSGEELKQFLAAPPHSDTATREG